MRRFLLVLIFALGGLALYFNAQGNTRWAVVCAIAVVYLSVRQMLTRVSGLLARLRSVPEGQEANSVLTYAFRLDRVFEHTAVDEVFAKLQKNGKAPAATLADWRRLLADSYVRKYKRSDLGCEIRFNVKSNLLFVNGEVSFGDHVWYELEVPYRSTESGEPTKTGGFLAPEVENQLEVRVGLVNGILLLQVGHFSKEYSPKILHEGSLAVYETFATVTSFPLMYFHNEHGIPVRYLNLIAKATDSYKASRAARGRGKPSDMFGDWRILQQEVAGYRILCGFEGEDHSYSAVDRLSEAFRAKRAVLLAANGYETFKNHEDDSRFPDTGHTYWNQYGKVFFRNMNANRYSGKDEHWFIDYYEEEP